MEFCGCLLFGLNDQRILFVSWIFSLNLICLACVRVLLVDLSLFFMCLFVIGF